MYMYVLYKCNKIINNGYDMRLYTHTDTGSQNQIKVSFSYCG